MPIVQENDPKTGNPYYGYIPPSSNILKEEVDHILNVFYKYVKEKGIEKREIFIDYDILGKIAVRLDQRCEYFKIYHKNTYLSEMRRVGILAYWIIKYKPFEIKMGDPYAWQNKIKINETIALHMIMCMVVRLVCRDDSKHLNISDSYRKKILHSFTEHDLTKEAFMIVAESLYENARIV